MPKITITEGPDSGKEYEIDQAVILGRLESNDVPIHDRKASREHAKIYKQGAKFAIVDLNSSNGTFVNGQKITKRVLADGDEIQIGVISMRFADATEKELAAAKLKQRKSLDDDFGGSGKGGAAAATPDPDKIVLTGHQPLQFRKIKKGNPVLGFDMDQLSDTARLVVYLGLIVVFGVLIYVSYSLVAS